MVWVEEGGGRGGKRATAANLQLHGKKLIPLNEWIIFTCNLLRFILKNTKEFVFKLKYNGGESQ